MNISKKLLIYFLIVHGYQTHTHHTQPVLLVDTIDTSDELHGILQSQKPTIIKLYSQNCPYCSMFAKTFEEYAKKHKSIEFKSANGKTLNAPKVISDFTKGTIKIPGYPSVVYIKNGSIVDYQVGGNPKVFEEKIQKLSHT